MAIMKIILLGFIAAACVAIATFLYLIWNASAVTAVMPNARTGYTVEALALNITILQIVLGLVGFLVAVLGFFGYAGIKSAAQDIAEKEARKVANAQMTKFKQQEVQTFTGQDENPGSYALEQAVATDAKPAEGE